MFNKNEFTNEICKLNPGIIFYFYNDIWPVCYGNSDGLKLPSGWIKKEDNTLYNVKEDISLKIIMLKNYVFPRPEDIIDIDDHYYLLMRPIKKIVSSYNGKEYVKGYNNLSRKKWVECVISQDRYRVNDGFLIEFEPLEDGYGNEVISYDSFLYNMMKGLIVKKEKDMECVLEVFNEPLYKDLYLRHSGYVLKKVKKQEDGYEK